MLEEIWNTLKCKIGESFVKPAGYTNSDCIMIVGEAPGKDEVKNQLPFVGASGNL